MQSDYHFWQDLFDTYQSLSDWVKIAWLATPLTLGIFALWALSLSARKNPPAGELVYTVRRDAEGSLLIYRHSDKTDHELLLEEY